MMLVAFKTEVTTKSKKFLNSDQSGNNFELIEIWQTGTVGTAASGIIGTVS